MSDNDRVFPISWFLTFSLITFYSLFLQWILYNIFIIFSCILRWMHSLFCFKITYFHIFILRCLDCSLAFAFDELRYFGTFVQHRKITRILWHCEDNVVLTNVVRKTLLERRCEKDVVRKMLESRCEKDIYFDPLLFIDRNSW